MYAIYQMSLTRLVIVINLQMANCITFLKRLLARLVSAY